MEKGWSQSLLIFNFNIYFLITSNEKWRIFLIVTMIYLLQQVSQFLWVCYSYSSKTAQQGIDLVNSCVVWIAMVNIWRHEQMADI